MPDDDSAMNEVFGHIASRPDHPDFWPLSQLVLRLDGVIEAAATAEAKEDAWQEVAKGNIDPEVLSYMALQRAVRALGITTRFELMAHAGEATRLASVYLDGFLTGAEWTKQRGRSS